MIMRLLLIICFLANAGMVLASQSTHKTLVVGSEEDFPPFAIGKTDETAGGYTVDLWREVAKETGLKYSIRVRPWSQILQEFKEGKIDVLINIAHSKDRYLYTDFSVPHVTVHGAIFVRHGSRIRSEDDLTGKSIIVFKSDLAHEYAVSRGWQKQLVIVSTAQEGLRLLASGQHDAMLLGKLTGMQTIKELNIKNVKGVDAKAGYSQKFSFGVRKGDAELLALLNEGLALTKTSGAYDAIHDKWFGIYEVQQPSLREMLPYIAPILVFFLIVGAYNFRKWRVERTQARKALRASEENLRLILDSAGEAIYGMDLDGNCTFCNAACVKMLGYSHPGELTGKNMHTLIHHSHSDGSCYPVEECRILNASESGSGSHVVDEVLWRSDGTCFAAEYRSYPQFREETIIGFVVTFTDITERRRSEKLMKESHERTLTILNGLDAIVYVADMTTYELLYVNDFLKKHFGDIAGQPCWKTLQSGQTGPCSFCSNDKLLDDAGNPTEIYRWEFQNTANGRWYDVRDRAIRWVDGRMVRLEIATDITDRKQTEQEILALEQQFQHTQKLESLGVLAGGIAHDFNNILTVIVGYCSLAKFDPVSAQMSIPEIEKAANRAADLCHQMLAYAGKSQFCQTQVNMRMLADEMVKMLKMTISKNVTIQTLFPAEIGFITGDASQLRQIIMNLIINASEAIGKAQGEIRVSLAETAISTGQAEKDHLGNLIPAGRYICLEVVDNGCGMDEETAKRIFEPFFTTKFIGRGLGMSAVLGIITSHRGALQLFTRQGTGTTFRIYLPTQDSNSTGDESLNQPTPELAWQGSGTVLLVDDEEQVRAIAGIMVKKLGFTVVEASNGKEALELYQKHATEITIVVTDMDMPVMDGYALFPELRKLNPDLPIIISSGFGDVDVTSRIAREDVAGFIGKPYRFEQVQDILKSVTASMSS